MTVEEYVQACSGAPRPEDALIDITWDLAHGYIEMLQTPPKRVSPSFTINEANALIEFIGLFKKAMADKNGGLYKALDANLSAATWQGAARCLEPLRVGVNNA
jgi:hypothetical protein